MTTSPAPQKHYGLRETVSALGQPKVASMFALGFSSGLPFLLSGATLGFWLDRERIDVATITYLQWVGLAYSFKFLWAPFIDRLPAPVLGFLGRRRGWAIFAQIIVAAALLVMAIFGPHGPGGLVMFGLAALVLAFASATQDIALDAWRIEASADADELGLLTSSFTLGFRVALLATDAWVLIFAQHFGWSASYIVLALLMGVGLFTAFRTPEPARADAVMKEKSNAAPLWTPRGVFDAIAGPFIEFFRAHGALALLMLLMVSLYRLPEFVIGPVAGPFYHAVGLNDETVGLVRGTVSLGASVLGIALGGICAVRLGYFRTLIVGALLQGLGVAGYAIVAIYGPNLWLFGSVMATDSFCYAFAGVALVTYMSSLTSLGYTATQYALLSSTYAMFGKFLKGFSGSIVLAFGHGEATLPAYAMFYAYAGAICLPALALCFLLAARQKPRIQAPAAA